ncbi:MAG: hypothetical protein HGGPFJEG_01456 [Ignavibacteria bacterium]|nr:hypothetical protein [Ignavibacteria bacterium]
MIIHIINGILAIIEWANGSITMQHLSEILRENL